jgi:ribonuclease BN (tRNA processing enzyme)
MVSSLLIVGSSSAVPRPNRANSSYLLRSENLALAIELGSGALSKLLAAQDVTALDALLVSHMHADHFFDIVPLRYALKYEMRRERALQAYLPPGGRRKLASVVAPFAKNGSFFDGVMDVAEYLPASGLRIGDARISFAKTRHYIDAYAMRIQLPGSTFAFSSDTAPVQNVIDLVRGADLFLCECALGADGRESGSRGHSNAKEAGAMAQAAGVKHLVLTHYSASSRAADLKQAAKSAFNGKITVADDGMELVVKEEE